MNIFLSYNSADHQVVESIARKLRDENLEPFLDRWQLKLEVTITSRRPKRFFERL